MSRPVLSPLEIGLAAAKAGLFDDAERLLRHAARSGPDQERIRAVLNLGQLLASRGRAADGETALAQAVGVAPNVAEFHDMLGSLRLVQCKYPAAVESFRAAIGLRPTFAEAHYNLGNALRDSGDPERARQAFLDALKLRPELAEAHNNLGNLSFFAGDPAGAIPHYRRALQLRPTLTAAWFNLGNALKAGDQFTQALQAYQEVGRHEPTHAGAYNNAGEVLERLNRPAEAAECYRLSASYDPGLFQPRRNLGSLLLLQGRMAEAMALLEEALKLRPDSPEILATLVHARLHVCQWDGLADLIAQLRRVADRGLPPPFMMATLPLSNAEQTAAARRWAGTFAVAPGAQFTPRARDRGERLHVGYLSGDFHGHATAFLFAEILELHDRAQVHVTAYSYGPDDESLMRQRLTAACEDFVDLRGTTDREAAELIHEDGVDILVDLKGYTEGARTKILAYRPAPVQVNWLGYPGSMGTPFIDYVIGDDVIGPPAFQADCDERIVRLPCFQPNDRKRARPEAGPSRRELGLPEDGVVFCCFNNSYKIMPPVFAIWMRLLRRVPDSVLWLLEANAAVRSNLLAEATTSGIDPARLVFAPRVPLEAHVARHLAADLFLDTQPVNALTTASDALWAGLPVVTMLGETVAGRGCASLLHAIGLPELVTSNAEEYEALAFRLATEPETLAAVADKLRANRETTALFDTPKFTRNLELAYQRMMAIHQAGEPPAAFRI